MSRRVRRRIHNTILETMTAIAAASVVLGSLAADSENYLIPVGMIVGGLLWLSLFFYANECGRRRR